MKSFFKKLSLVLAAAMIITLIPAQQTKAAGATLVYTEQAEKDKTKAITNYSLKVDETVDLKVWNATDYKTNGKGWVSSNPGVATVDKTGLVKAIAVGTTEVIYECTGHDQQPVLIQVTGEYKVKVCNQDDKNTIISSYTFEKIGDKVDLGFLGATGYTASKYDRVWTSSNEKAVKVVNAADGIIEAVGAGEATVVLTLTEKTTGKVAFAVEPLKVTVKGAVGKLEVKVTAYNKVLATVGEKKYPETVNVFKGEDRFVEYVKYDKETGVIEFYDDLVNGETYYVKSGEQETSFKPEIGQISKFEVKWYTKPGKEKMYSKAYVNNLVNFEIVDPKDENDVVVNADYTVQYIDKSNGIENSFYGTPSIFISSVEDVHNITVKLIKKGTEYSEKPVVLGTKTLDPIKGIALDNAELQRSTVGIKLGVNGTSYKDSSDKLVVSTTDLANRGLAFYAKDQYGNEYTYAAGMVTLGGVAGTEGATITFKSNNPDVLGVESDGTLEAREAGKSASIYVYANYPIANSTEKRTVLLAVKEVKVDGKRVPASHTFTTASNSFYANNFARLADIPGADNYDKVTFRFTVKDQLGEEIDITAGDVKVTYLVNGKEQDNVDEVAATVKEVADKNTVDVTFDAARIAASGDATKTVNAIVKITKNNVSRTQAIALTIVNLDNENVKKTYVQPAILVKSGQDIDLGSIKGGNTNDVSVDLIVCEAFNYGGYVYGNAITTNVKNISTLDKKTVDQLKSTYTSNKDAIYMDLKLDDKAAVFTATGSVYQVVLREKTTNDATGAAIVAKTTSKVLTADLYKLDENGNKIRQTAYDKINSEKFENKDAATLALKIEFTNVTGSDSDKNDWVAWLGKNAKLTGAKNLSTGVLKETKEDGTKVYYMISDGDGKITIADGDYQKFEVTTMKAGSSYLETLKCSFFVKGQWVHTELKLKQQVTLSK